MLKLTSPRLSGVHVKQATTKKQKNFISDQFTKILNNLRRRLIFLQYLENISPFRILVHMNNRLLKIGLPVSKVNQPVCYTYICM